MSTPGRDQSVNGDAISGTKIKIPPPDKFLGERRMLSPLLTQLDTYIRLNRAMFKKESDKILFASAHLRSDALNWFEPTLRDYMENEKKDRDDETKSSPV